MQKTYRLFSLSLFFTLYSLTSFSKTFFPQDTVFEEVWIVSDTSNRPPLVLKKGTILEFYKDGDKKRRYGKIKKITSDGFVLKRKSYRLEDIIWLEPANRTTHILSNLSLPVAGLSLYFMAIISEKESSQAILNILLTVLALAFLLLFLQGMMIFIFTKTIFKALIDKPHFELRKKPFEFKKSKLPKR